MVVRLSPQDLADLKRQGFSEEEISKAVSEIEREDMAGSVDDYKQDPRSRSQTSSFSSRSGEDIARYQLELNDLLEQTEHILKGDIVKWEGGMKIWVANPHPEDNPLNDEGIRKIMLELQTYINRHIILGDYDERDINHIMKDYGRKLTDFLFMQYEEMGMDSEKKRQEYASVVMNIVNLVYASYSRAKDGGERRSLREMINISQNSNSNQGQMMGMNGGMMAGGQIKTRGLLNPMRYIAGKYV